MIKEAIAFFFGGFFEELIAYFSTILVDVMATSVNVLQLPLVQNGILYAQSLSFTLLVLKSIKEGIQTYILYQNGDTDADPSGLIIRTGQAVAIIATMPWIVLQIFTFGTKVAADVAKLSGGQAGVADWAFITTSIVASGGIVIPVVGIVLAVMLLVVAIQATIRGAELALVSVLGPVMAVNLSANNRSVWTQWFKQVLIICTAQALQIFMLKGALSLMTSQVISNGGILLVFGWLWVTIKTPKFVQQFAYSTGFSGAVGGTAKQAGSMYLMRKMMVK
jgi:hypothetical protein